MKLYKNPETRPVEISKLLIDQQLHGRKFSEEYNVLNQSSRRVDPEDSEYDYSVDDIRNNYRVVTINKKFEFFTGEDPCCNCANLVNKVRKASSAEILICLIWILFTVFVTIAIVYWFRRQTINV